MTVDHAGPAGRHELAAVELQPGDEDVLRLRQAAVSGIHALGRPSRRASRGQSADARQRDHARRRLRRPRPGYFTAIDADDGRDRVAEALARVVLLAARPRPPATSSSSAATPASSRPTTPQTASCSGASRPAPARTTTPTVFEHDGQGVPRLPRGRQRARRDAARRQPLAFSLDGTIGPAAARRRRRRASEHAGETPSRADREARRRRRPARRVFADNCSGCHGAARHGRQRRPRPHRDPDARHQSA